MNPTIINFPSVTPPSKATWKLQRFDTRFISPLSGTFQDIQRAGSQWQCNLSWSVLDFADSQSLAAWADQMSQGGTRTLLPNFAYTPRSAPATVTVNGAGQSGTTLNVSGFSAYEQNVAYAGDFFTVANGTQHQLLRITANANADGSGNAALHFSPALRFSPTNGSNIFLGVTPTPNPAVYKSDWQGNQLQYATPRTNILHASNNFTAASWTNNNCTITSGAVAGPDGTAGAGTELAVSTVNNPYIVDVSYTVPAMPPKSIAGSIWVKAGNISQVSLNLYQIGLGGVNANGYILYGPGSVSGSGTSVVTFSGLSTTAWTHIGFVTTGNLISGYQFNFYIKPQNTTINVGDYVYIAYAEEELANYLASYIPTTSTPVTVTDYSLSGNQITFASAPANSAALTFLDLNKTAFTFGTGNGTATVWTLGIPAAVFAFAKPDSSMSYTAPQLGALALSLVEDITL